MAGPSFAVNIRPLFRDSDIEAMKPRGIDLSSYSEVRKRASDIYVALSEKSMPCDGPWDEEKMKKFREWMDEGTQP